jgi:Glycosyl transferase family 2
MNREHPDPFPHSQQRYTAGMQPVSVIATVLNEAENIPRLVGSLLAQVPPSAEIIVVDGGSTDGTWEWLRHAAQKHSGLRPIRDETCSLGFTPGPISKGRNTAIQAARSELIACADAGCTYAPSWLAKLTAPLVGQQAEYALGGSCLDMVDPTLWDLASAPFLGVKLSATTPSKSCTARSMAFTRDLWRRLGGFPETVFFGEDTQFDLEARQVTRPAFPPDAKALYRPQNSFRSACQQMARYAVSDGILGVRTSRLLRNTARCVAEAAALVALWWTWIPLAAVLLMILHFAFSQDGLLARTLRPRVLLARLAFSILVPWIVMVNRIRGSLTKKSPANAQNARA